MKDSDVAIAITAALMIFDALRQFPKVLAFLEPANADFTLYPEVRRAWCSAVVKFQSILQFAFVLLRNRMHALIISAGFMVFGLAPGGCLAADSKQSFQIHPFYARPPKFPEHRALFAWPRPPP